jgi:hypothetical protein
MIDADKTCYFMQHNALPYVFSGFCFLLLVGTFILMIVIRKEDRSIIRDYDERCCKK